jgi:hypothetical protein
VNFDMKSGNVKRWLINEFVKFLRLARIRTDCGSHCLTCLPAALNVTFVRDKERREDNGGNLRLNRRFMARCTVCGKWYQDHRAGLLFSIQGVQ